LVNSFLIGFNGLRSKYKVRTKTIWLYIYILFELLLYGQTECWLHKHSSSITSNGLLLKSLAKRTKSNNNFRERTLAAQGIVSRVLHGERWKTVLIWVWKIVKSNTINVSCRKSVWIKSLRVVLIKHGIPAKKFVTAV